MPSILLVHGIQAGGTTFWRGRRDLEDLGWSVTAPDLPGHRGRPWGPPSLRALADDLLAQTRGSAFDLVVGHSLGALVALEAAAIAPELQRTVLLEDPPALGGGLHPRDAAGDVRAKAERALEDPEGEVVAVLVENPAWSATDARTAVENRAALDVDGAERFLDADRWDLPALVGACPVPVHLLAADGDGSALVEPDRAEVLRLVGPERTTVVVSGHGVHRDRPGLWLQTVLRAAAG